MCCVMWCWNSNNNDNREIPLTNHSSDRNLSGSTCPDASQQYLQKLFNFRSKFVLFTPVESKARWLEDQEEIANRIRNIGMADLCFHEWSWSEAWKAVLIGCKWQGNLFLVFICTWPCLWNRHLTMKNSIDVSPPWRLLFNNKCFPWISTLCSIKAAFKLVSSSF